MRTAPSRGGLPALVALTAVVLAAVGVPAAAQSAPPAVQRWPRGAEEVPAGWPLAPEVTAAAYLLADLGTGQVLAAREADDRRAVASAVKVLTAYTVLVRTDAARTVTAGPEAAVDEPGAAGVGLDPGETWTVEDLLEGLIARSGNDAARALAVAVGGSVGGFAELMGADARRLGVEGAVLATPDGLADTNRLSARDLLTVTRAAMSLPPFAAIAARPRVELPDVGTVRSRNELLDTYPGAVGVKTGYTSAAGRCLIAAAERQGRRLVAVVLGSADPDGHFRDAVALLDFGFTTFTSHAVTGPGVDVELKVAGSWLPYDATAADVHVPAGSPAPDVRASLPARPGTGIRVVAGPEGSALVEVEAASTTGQARDSTQAAAVGAWVVDRAYDAMRGATGHDRWPPPGAAG